jgi:2-dehydropantoate 2-reductase
VGDIMATAAGEKLTLALLGECSAVAKAAGHATPENMMNTYRGMLTARGSQVTASMLRDVESGSRAEGAHILGDLLARAGKLGVATPVLETAAANLEAYEARRKREKPS